MRKDYKDCYKEFQLVKKKIKSSSITSEKNDRVSITMIQNYAPTTLDVNQNTAENNHIWNGAKHLETVIALEIHLGYKE